MAEELKGLIEKIQREGIQAAEQKAKEIEEEARRQAEALIEKARRDSQRLLQEARQQIAQTEESTHASLKQAGRDLILSLRSELQAMLERLVASHIRSALTPAELAEIIRAFVEKYHGHEKGGIVIALNKNDLAKIEHGFLGQLKDAAKKGIVLKPCEDVSAGLTISYDAGQSLFDFSDKALADYIATYLKPKLAEILEGTKTE